MKLFNRIADGVSCVFGDRRFTKGTGSLAGILFTEASANTASSLYLFDILLITEKLASGAKAIMDIHSLVRSFTVH